VAKYRRDLTEFGGPPPKKGARKAVCIVPGIGAWARSGTADWGASGSHPRTEAVGGKHRNETSQKHTEAKK